MRIGRDAKMFEVSKIAKNIGKKSKKSEKKRNFSINPVFFVVLVWLAVNFGVLSFFGYLLAILIHEVGHYFVARALGYHLSKFSLSPYGVSLSYYGEEIDERDDVLIALAGPLSNIASVFLCYSLWWVCPATFNILAPLASVSLVIALFNLLPCYPLDGGRVFVNLSSKFLERKRAVRLTYVFNLLFAIFFFVIFVILCFVDFNPTYLLFSVFLILGLLDLSFLSQYERVSIYEKRTKSFSKPRVFVVDENITLKELLRRVRKNRTTIFILILKNGKSILLSDEAVLRIVLKVDINTKIGELYQKNAKKS